MCMTASHADATHADASNTDALLADASHADALHADASLAGASHKDHPIMMMIALYTNDDDRQNYDDRIVHK